MSTQLQVGVSLTNFTVARNPHLLPYSPLDPVVSGHLNELAHAMWNNVINNGPMYHNICVYAAMSPYPTLRVLALRGEIPAWFWMRQMCKHVLTSMGRPIEDGMYLTSWRESEREIEMHGMTVTREQAREQAREESQVEQSAAEDDKEGTE